MVALSFLPCYTDTGKGPQLAMDKKDTERFEGMTTRLLAGLLTRAKPSKISVYVVHTNVFAREILLRVRQLEQTAGRVVGIPNRLRLESGALVMVATPYRLIERLRGLDVHEVVLDHYVPLTGDICEMAADIRLRSKIPV